MKWVRVLISVAVFAAALVGITTYISNQSKSVSIPHDGKSALTSAPSCWAIRQQYPEARSGTFWLVTPTMPTPKRFFCDLETRGGGWVLVGRGREGWTFSSNGQGSETDLWKSPSGTSAFRPATLDEKTIDQLLNGIKISSLPDGIRLNRSTKPNDEKAQEIRLYPEALDNWTWGFDAGIPLEKLSIDDKHYSGGNTRDTAVPWAGNNNSDMLRVKDTRRIFTFPNPPGSGIAGFGMANVAGADQGATNHVWKNPLGTHTLPFTQIWLRPKIDNDTFKTLNSGDLSSLPTERRFQENPQLLQAGVSGVDHTNEEKADPWRSPVLTLKQYQNDIYVGGRFQNIKEQTGKVTKQPFLAAFSSSGTPNYQFVPKLNGRVWDIVETEDGALIIGGDFTTVNGETSIGLAKIDPTTGHTVDGFKANLTRNHDTFRPRVRALTKIGGTVYATGTFSKYLGHDWQPIGRSNAVAFESDTGRPTAWKPHFPSGPINLFASEANNRIYGAGYFEAVNHDTSVQFAVALTSDTAELVEGLRHTPETPETKDRFQFAVAEVDNSLWLGGGPHVLRTYDINTGERSNWWRGVRGGDFQAIHATSDTVFASCHCGEVIVDGTNVADWTKWSQTHDMPSVTLIAAYDRTTHKLIDDWEPHLTSPTGDGPWALEEGSNGCLWVGGDIAPSTSTEGSTGNFFLNIAKFCRVDRKPPTPPRKLTSTIFLDDKITLKWKPGSGKIAGETRYALYREDRIVATTTKHQVTLENFGQSRWFVTSVDKAGNRSESTEVHLSH